MTDFEGLRPTRRPLPDPAALRSARAVGLRRRWYAGTSTVLLGVATAAVVWVSPTPGGGDSLGPARDSDGVVELSESAPPRPGASPAGGAADGGRGGDGRPVEPAPSAERERPTASPVPGRGGVLRPALVHGPMTRSELPYESSGGGGPTCPPATLRGQQVCTTDKASHVRGDGTWELQLTTCAIRSDDALQLVFATEEEVALEIRSTTGEVVWRWRPATPFAATRHSVRLDAGRCARWTTVWRGVDDAGRAVPKGTYVLQATPKREGGVAAGPRTLQV